MKKATSFLLPIILGLLFPIIAHAQVEKGSYSVSVGLGVITSEQYNDAVEDLGHLVVTAGTLGTINASIVNRTYSPAFYLSGGRMLSNRIYVGLAGAFEKATGDYQQDNQIVGNFRRKTFSVAAEGRINYLNKAVVTLYGTGALGFTFNSQVSNRPAEWTEFVPVKNHFTGYVSPIGARFGKDLGGYLELGYGYKGVLNAGINYRF